MQGSVKYARHGCGSHGYGRMGMVARHGCGSHSERPNLDRDS